MRTLSQKAETIAVEHWLWLRRAAPCRNHASVYKMLERPSPQAYEGPDGIIKTMAEIWMEELADDRDA